jgi:hypothetical protein
VKLPELLSFYNRDSLRVEITAPALNALEANGGATLTARGATDEALALTANGSGRIEAFGFAAHDVVARGQGAAQLELCADGRLELHLSGGSHATYQCHPAQVSDDISGGSSAEGK